MSTACSLQSNPDTHVRCLSFYLIVNLWAGTSLALAQNLYTALGPLAERNVAGNVLGIFANESQTDDEFDFGVYGSHHITLTSSRSPSEISMKTLRLKDPIERVIAADCNRDGHTDLVAMALHSTSSVVSVYLAQHDTFRLGWSDELPFIPEQIAVGDVNLDRKVDILLYGRRSLGVYVLLGNGDGTFRSSPPILEDYSFSHILVHDFNKDRLMDLLAYDWVRNELLLFSAIGPVRFTIPAVISLPSELTDVALAYVNNDHDVDLVLLYKDPGQLHTMHGDGLGSFGKEREIRLSYQPTKLLVGDLNGDRREDVIVFSEAEKAFFTYVNEGGAFSAFGVGYAAATGPDDMIALRSDRTEISRLVVLDRSRRTIHVYYHYLQSYGPEREQTYTLGLQAQSLVVFDANRNGLPDLLVTNAQSQHLSLFLNRGDGTFIGQIPIRCERFAESLYAFWTSESTFVCVTTHPTIDKIVITEVAYPDFESHVTTIAAPSAMEVLAQSYDPGSRSFTMLLASQRYPGYSLVEIGWSATGRESPANAKTKGFSEQTFFRTPQGTTLAVELCDVNRDGVVDVLYVQRDERRRNCVVYVATGLQSEMVNGQPRRRFEASRAVLTVPDTGWRDVRAWCVDLNEDGIQDLILQYQADNDYMGISFGKLDGSFSPMRDIFSHVRIQRRSDIVYTDVNGDGIKDLVVSNALRRAIQIFAGKGEGKFSRPRRLLSFPSGGAFAVFDANADQIPDYSVVFAEPGVLKIFLGKE